MEIGIFFFKYDLRGGLEFLLYFMVYYVVCYLKSYIIVEFSYLGN